MKDKKKEKILRKYLFQKKGATFFLFLVKLIDALLQTGVALLIYFFMDFLSKGSSTKDALWMGLLGLGYIALCSFFVAYDFYLSHRMANHAIKEYKDEIVKRILFDTASDENTGVSSRSLTLIQKDVSEALDSYFLPCLELISHCFTFLSALVISMILNPLLASLMLALAIFIIFVPNLYNKTLSEQRNHLSDENLRYSSFLGNAFKGKPVVQNGSAEDRFSKRNNQETSLIEKKQNHLWATYGQENGIMHFLVLFLEVGAFFLAGILYLNNLCSLSVAVALFSISSDIYNPLTRIVSSILEMKSYQDILKKIERIPDSYETIKTQNAESNRKPDIVLSHLTLQFKERVLLEDVSLRIPFGSKVLITGESGSGKTTLFESLLGYKKTEKGSILFGEDAIPSSKLIAYCPQTPVLFLGTLKENITLFGTPDEDRLEEVIHCCGLDSFVGKRGKDVLLNDFDSKISLGEMQRISLARALYLNRDILLLDEVTSSLDKENTDIILHTLKEIQDKTVILISHQLDSADTISFDCHYVLENKKLVLVSDRK